MRDSDDRLLPPDALRLPVGEVVRRLERRMDRSLTDLMDGATDPLGVPRPIAANESPRWITRANLIGINVRTVGSFWRVVHYSLTLPPTYTAVHLLPIWEPGVVGSLYGIASRDIAGEFHDSELAREYPAFATPERQLRLTVALLHLQRRAVGVDVIPHTDRFSEIVLCNPTFFDWVRVSGKRIVDRSPAVAGEVEAEIADFVRVHGSCTRAGDSGVGDLWTIDESQRRRILFGEPGDPAGRRMRRDALISRLRDRGYEPLPATMGPPYVGLELDPKRTSIDAAGRVWHEYRFVDPQPMSRAFGPLARYSFYERTRDSAHGGTADDWRPDFDKPRPEVFDYLADMVAETVESYGFDFMRGDMSHVQMRPDGVPTDTDRYYDPLRYVKERVAKERASFAYFAEGFLSPPGTMAYGDEIDHLEACRADVTLGDLQSVAVDDDAFLPRLRRAIDIGATRAVRPSFTVMTGDKDDPRFDAFYRFANELRAFCALFLVDSPSYTALGFELRDRHDAPAPNECYTKLYVFHEERGPKATHGPYRFGGNTALYDRLTSIHEAAARLLPTYGSGSVEWLLPPDATAGNRVIAWIVRAEPGPLLCIANTASTPGYAGGAGAPVHEIVPWPAAEPAPNRLLLAVGPETDPTSTPRAEEELTALPMGEQVDRSELAARIVMPALGPGECRLYRYEVAQ